jgi:hypothetical protein
MARIAKISAKFVIIFTKVFFSIQIFFFFFAGYQPSEEDPV